MGKRRLSTQILASQLTILVAALLIGFGLFAGQERAHLDREYEDRALVIAQAVANIPEIRQAMEYGDANGAVAGVADRIQRESGALYVVVIGLDQVRHSHPNPALIGKPVSEPLIVLDGKGHTGTNNDSLGPSANGKAPIVGVSGNIVGEVSVGIREDEVALALQRELPAFALYFGIALGVGALAAYVLAWRLKRTTFGLELHEFASLLQEREAMLYGIREGVIGFDRAGRLSVINDEARRLLGIGGGRPGQPLNELVPAGRLRDVLTGAAGEADQTVLTDKRCLTVNRMPVTLQGRELGAIVTLRDRTELVDLMRELDSVRGLSDALRAQHHEFANQMHTVAGLIELGDADQALTYITQLQEHTAVQAEALRERIGPPLVAALVLGKQTVAAERGVVLRVTDDSWLDESATHTQILLTILGNLLDNAIDAAVESGQPQAWVSLHVTEDDTTTTVIVGDSGSGVPAELCDVVFLDGYSTKPLQGSMRRGLGLALVHRLVTRVGGTIAVTPGSGGVFTVTLPGVT